MKYQIQCYLKWCGKWDSIGKPLEYPSFVELWNAELRSCFYPKNEYGHPYLRAVDENGNVTHGIGSKDYDEYIAYLKERES